MIKKIGEKTYFKEDGVWYGTNKNGDKYKVTLPKTLLKLSEGLGDVVSAVTQSLKITECEPCKKRKETLNSIFSWTRKKDIRKITDEEKQFMKSIKEGDSSVPIFKLYNDLFHQNIDVCNCPGLVKVMITRINLAIEIDNDNLTT